MALRERAYSDADLPAVQHALAEWIHAAGPLGYCHTGEIPHRIYENLQGRQPVGELVHVWEEGPDVVGIVIAARYDRAFDVFAAPELRGTEAEVVMLERGAELTSAHVRTLETDHESVENDAWDGDDARTELLTRLGFERYRLWDLTVERDLSLPIDSVPLAAGFTLRTATMDDAAGLAQARNDSFGADWTAESFRAEVLEKPGCPPEIEVVAVAPDGTIAAFAGVWCDARNRVGHFEPVGTHAGFRRRGLARAVMTEGLRRMRREGMETVTLDHDADNTAAAALYTGLGFRTKFELYGWRRDASGRAHSDRHGAPPRFAR